MGALVKWSHQRIVLAMLMWELKYCSRYSLAGMCKLNDVKPEFRLQHVLDVVGRLDDQTATVALHSACGITSLVNMVPGIRLTQEHQSYFNELSPPFYKVKLFASLL